MPLFLYFLLRLINVKDKIVIWTLLIAHKAQATLFIIAQTGQLLSIKIEQKPPLFHYPQAVQFEKKTSRAGSDLKRNLNPARAFFIPT